MNKLIVIDGNAIMHRAFHAIPKLTTGKKPINAVYGFTSMLFSLVNDLEPTHIAVCFDRPEPTFRKNIYPKYQSQRPDMDDELIPQFELVKKVLEAMNICIFDKAGYEADDLIGTIAFQARDKGIDEVIIVTGDKDILQLVDDSKKIKVYMPTKGMSQCDLINEEGVVKKLGVGPGKIIDYKALVGDPSDNYPGIKGIGPVGAKKLIEEYGSYKNIYNNIDKIKEKERLLLENNKKNGDVSYKLAEIIKNVDINIDSLELNKWSFNSSEVKNIFLSLGFRSLVSRVSKEENKNIKEKQMSLI